MYSPSASSMQMMVTSKQKFRDDRICKSEANLDVQAKQNASNNAHIDSSTLTLCKRPLSFKLLVLSSFVT